MNNKKRLAALMMTAVLAGPAVMTPTVMANSVGGSVEEQADITNWVANTPQQISNNMAMQHINTNDLNGTKYIVQWGDTLSGISAATGISVAKLAYDNHIQNINLIYAGQVLILNRNGQAPANYHYEGDPNQVVISKTTINNGPKNVKFVVSPKVTVNNDNSDNRTTNVTENNNNNSNDDDDDTTATSDNHSDKKSNDHSTTSDETPNEKLANKLNKAAEKNDDELNFSAYDEDNADDLKAVDMDDDADELNDLIKSGKIKKAEALIKDHLDDDDEDVYVDIDDGEVTVYTKHSDDDDSSESESSDQDSSNSQADSNDDYDADEDDE